MRHLGKTIEREISEVVHLRDSQNKTFSEISDKLGFSERTARRRYEAGLLGQHLENLVDDEIKEFPEVNKIKIEDIGIHVPVNKEHIERFKPLTRHGDAMVICDLHIPLHDPKFINVMINCAQANGIKQLIIGGDYFHMDQFGSYLPYQPEANLEIEREDGNIIMKTLLKTFDEVDFIWGNHDFRLTKKLGYTKSFEDCMKWMLSELTEDELAKIRFSDLDYMHYYSIVDNKGPYGLYKICHPRNFSSVPLTVARRLADKFGCSIITAHSHHFAMGVAYNGKDIVIEGGGFYDKHRTEYIQRTTKSHEWVQGFTFFKDGIPTLVSPAFGNDRQYR